MEKLSREAKSVIRRADQLLETGKITYNKHRKIVEDVRKGRTISHLEKKAAKEIVQRLKEDRSLNREERRARVRKLRRRKKRKKIQ